MRGIEVKLTGFSLISEDGEVTSFLLLHDIVS